MGIKKDLLAYLDGKAELERETSSSVTYYVMAPGIVPEIEAARPFRECRVYSIPQPSGEIAYHVTLRGAWAYGCKIATVKPSYVHCTFQWTAGKSITVEGIVYTMDEDIFFEYLISDMCPPIEPHCFAHGSDGSYVELFWYLDDPDDLANFDPMSSTPQILISEEDV